MEKVVEEHPQTPENITHAHSLFDAVTTGDWEAAKKLRTEIQDTVDTHWAERVYPLRDEIYRFVSDVRERFSNIEDQQRLIEALRLMLDIHVDQKNRIDGVPVIAHTLAVGDGVLRNYSAVKPDEVVAALMHDSIEDRPTLLAKMGGDVDLAEADEDFLRREAYAFIQKQFGYRVANLVQGLTSPLPYPHSDEIKDDVAISLSADAYRTYMQSLIKSEDAGLIAIKWEDARQNLPLDNLARGGNGQEVEATAKKHTYLRLKYGPVLKEEWLPFWKDMVDDDHPLYSQREEALEFIENLINTDYAEK